MIGRLRGEVIEVAGPLVLIDVAGVGYEVQVPELVALLMPPVGQETTLLIRQIFREDGVSLYGFSEGFQRRMFDLLLEVKGCGPKVALALLGQVGDETVASAIAAQDAKVLIKATGVGIKLAERIILELKDKMLEESLKRKLPLSSGPKKTTPDELINVLLDLGYRRQEAEAAAASARETPGQIEEQLKHALKLLQKVKN